MCKNHQKGSIYINVFEKSLDPHGLMKFCWLRDQMRLYPELILNDWKNAAAMMLKGFRAASLKLSQSLDAFPYLKKACR